MAQRCSAANNSPLVSRTKLFEAVAKGLCNEIGRGKRRSVKEVSNHTGVPDRTIECAKLNPENPDWRPLSTEQLISLSSFLGPIFTTEWLAVAQQGAFWLPDESEIDPGELAAANSEDNAVVVRAALDRKFDHEERPKLRLVGEQMIERGERLVALGGA